MSVLSPHVGFFFLKLGYLSYVSWGMFQTNVAEKQLQESTALYCIFYISYYLYFWKLDHLVMNFQFYGMWVLRLPDEKYPAPKIWLVITDE
jgi:hypothetical protein